MQKIPTSVYPLAENLPICTLQGQQVQLCQWQMASNVHEMKHAVAKPAHTRYIPAPCVKSQQISTQHHSHMSLLGIDSPCQTFHRGHLDCGRHFQQHPAATCCNEQKHAALGFHLPRDMLLPFIILSHVHIYIYIMYIYIYLYIYIYIWLFIYLFICLFIYLSKIIVIIYLFLFKKTSI